jgi:hypothetical protein
MAAGYRSILQPSMNIQQNGVDVTVRSITGVIGVALNQHYHLMLHTLAGSYVFKK